MSAGEQKLRLFVALPVPPQIRNALAEIQRELRRLLPAAAASWAHPDRMHLTLRFLGDVAPARAEALISSLSAAVRNFGQLDLVVEQVGCFPDMHRPRVVWTGVHDCAQRLPELQRRVVSATAAFTREPEEKRFTGHVTLARLKQTKRLQVEAIAAFVRDAANRQFGAWTVEKVELIRSELSASGSHYTGLAEFQL